MSQNQKETDTALIIVSVVVRNFIIMCRIRDKAAIAIIFGIMFLRRL